MAFSEEVDATGDDLLTTIFFQNNSFAGNSFDITASTDLTVVGFEVNLDPLLPSCTVNIWTREGTANSFEQIATGWTLLGTDVVVPAGINYPTHVDVGGLEISSGETVGVIFTVEEAGGPDGGLMYTNGGPNTYSNSNMSIITCRGLSGGFPVAFLRQVSGSIASGMAQFTTTTEHPPAVNPGDVSRSGFSEQNFVYAKTAAVFISDPTASYRLNESKISIIFL